MLIHQLERGVGALHLNVYIVLNIRKPIRLIRDLRFDIHCTRLDWEHLSPDLELLEPFKLAKHVLVIQDNLLYIKLNINTEQTSVISVINPKIYPEMRHCLADNFIDVE